MAGSQNVPYTSTASSLDANGNFFDLFHLPKASKTVLVEVNGVSMTCEVVSSSATKGQKGPGSGVTSRSKKFDKVSEKTKAPVNPSPFSPPPAPVSASNATAPVSNQTLAPVPVSNPTLAPAPVQNPSFDLSFTMKTLPADSSGLIDSIISDQIATSLVGGPAILVGAVPSDIMLKVCDKIVNEGKFSFKSEIFMPGYSDVPLITTLNLQATGGCGNPLAPALIETKFVDSFNHTFGIICASDVTLSGFCAMWLGGQDITAIWNTRSRRLSSSREVKTVPDSVAGTLVVSPTSTRELVECVGQIATTAAVSVGAGVACYFSFGTACAPAVTFAAGTTTSLASCEITAANNNGCFPGDAEVFTPTGKASIGDIKVGDQVATAITEKGAMQYEIVYFLGHDDANAYSTFYRIEMNPVGEEMERGTVDHATAVEMTAFHFVPVLVPSHNSHTENWVNTRAKDIRVGDIILALTQDADRPKGLTRHNVTAVNVVQKRGLFNPYTMSGRILVNNVSVSTHSEWILDPFFDALGLTSWLPNMYQLILSPLRMLVHLLGAQRYAKTSIAPRLTKFILAGFGGEASEELPDSKTIVANLSAAASSLLGVLYLFQKKGEFWN